MLSLASVAKRHCQSESYCGSKQQQVLLDDCSTCTTVKISNHNPNRYTDRGAESRIQELVSAFGEDEGNRGRAINFASFLLSGAQYGDDLVTSVNLRVVDREINDMQLNEASAEHLRNTAHSVWMFFQEHHGDHYHQINAVLQGFSDRPQGEVVVSGAVENGSASDSTLTSPPSVDVEDAARGGNVPAAHAPEADPSSVVSAGDDQHQPPIVEDAEHEDPPQEGPQDGVSIDSTLVGLSLESLNHSGTEGSEGATGSGGATGRDAGNPQQQAL